MSIYGNVIGGTKPTIDAEVSKDSTNAVQSGAVHDYVEDMHDEIIETIGKLAESHSSDKSALEEQLGAIPQQISDAVAQKSQVQLITWEADD